jgi:hypothetical protein
MTLILQIACAILLANCVAGVLRGFLTGRAQAREWRRMKLDIDRRYGAQSEEPSRHYTEYAPGVRYDSAGVAVNAIPGATRPSWPFVRLVMLAVGIFAVLMVMFVALRAVL